MENTQEKTKKLPEQNAPYELYIKLESGETKVTSYACGTCHIVRHDYESAKKCCEHHFCVDCGKDLGIKNYYHCCPDCRRKAKFEKAETIEYTDQILADEGGDYYFETLDDAIDHYWDDFRNDNGSIPENLFVCEVDKWDGIDLENVIENEMENHHEDAGDQIVDYDEIEAFIKDWNAKQTLETWNVTYKQKIDFRKIMLQEWEKELQKTND